MTAETEYGDVLKALKGSNMAEVPAELQARVTGVARADEAPAPPWGAFEEHADELYRYLIALVEGDSWLAEHVLGEAFARVGDLHEPTLPELVQAARHAGLEALAKSGPLDAASPLSHGDRALVLERRMGLSTEDLARIHSQMPSRLTERFEACGAHVLHHLEQQEPERAKACDAWRERLPRAVLGLLDDAGAEAYAKHRSECTACAQWTDLLEETMTPPNKTLPAPDKTRQRLEERLQSAHCVPVDMGIQVSVSCCYCHDAMQRQEAAFCATCLAPHHPDCFEQHGRCATPGCAGTDVVYPTRHRRTPKRPRLGLVLGMVALFVGLAAFGGFGYSLLYSRAFERDVAMEARAQAEADRAAAEQARAQAEKARAERVLGLGTEADADLDGVLVFDEEVDAHRPLTFLETEITDVPAGEYTIPKLVEIWSKANGIATTVDPQLAGTKVTLTENRSLTRTHLRALYESVDAVMVVGAEKTASVHHRRNLAQKVAAEGSLVEGDTPVDPDAFVTRVIKIRHGAGQQIFATVRGLLTRDTNRIGNILFVQGPEELTIVDLARKVRTYEEVVVHFDHPQARRRQVRVEVFRASQSTWKRLRSHPPADILQQLRISEAESGVVLIESTDLNIDDMQVTQNSGNVSLLTRQVRSKKPGSPKVPLTIELSARLTNPTRRAVTLTLTAKRESQRSGELHCSIPLQDKVSIQATLLADDDFLVFAVSEN